VKDVQIDPNTKDAFNLTELLSSYLLTDDGHPASLFVRLISHQPAVLFSQNKPATSNQPTVFFSHNKPAPAISHQPNEQAWSAGRAWLILCPISCWIGYATSRDASVGILG
jgi:hypothetical protein